MKFYFLCLCLFLFQNVCFGTIANLNSKISIDPEKDSIQGETILKYKSDDKEQPLCFQLDYVVGYSIFINNRLADSLTQEGNNICLLNSVHKHRLDTILIKYELQTKFPSGVKNIYLNTLDVYWIPKFKMHNTINHLETTFYLRKPLQVIGNGIIKTQQNLDSKEIKWKFESTDISYDGIYFFVGTFNSFSSTSKKETQMRFIYNQEMPKIMKLSTPIFNLLEEQLGPFPSKTYFQSTIPINDSPDDSSNILFIPSHLLDITKNPKNSYIGYYAYQTALKWLHILPESLKQSFATYYKWHTLKKFYGTAFYDVYLHGLKASVLSGSDPINQNAFILSAIEREIGEVRFQNISYNFLSGSSTSYSILGFKFHLLNKIKDSVYYFDEWIKNNKAFPFDKAFEKINHTDAVSIYNTVTKLSDKPLELKYDVFKKIMTSTQTYLTKHEVIKQLGTNLIDKDFEIIKLGIESNDFYLNNFILDYYTEVPKELKDWADSLFIKKPDYLNEKRLINFCSSFHKNCGEYTTKYLSHSTSKFKEDYATLAQLFSTILSTDDPKVRSEALKKVTQYTGHKNLDIRKKVFKLLNEKAILLDSILKHLILGTTHENKDYAVFCKNFIKKVQKTAYYKVRIEKINQDLVNSSSKNMED